MTLREQYVKNPGVFIAAYQSELDPVKRAAMWRAILGKA